MSRMLRLLLLLLLAALPIAACSTSGTPAPGATAFTAVIDVRTPAEFAAGHVEGAMNLDVEGAAFDTQVAALDRSGSYLLYCRSGNRSRQAAQRMADAGVTVTDGGGLEAMRSAGWTFVN